MERGSGVERGIHAIIRLTISFGEVPGTMAVVEQYYGFVIIYLAEKVVAKTSQTIHKLYGEWNDFTRSTSIRGKRPPHR